MAVMTLSRTIGSQGDHIAVEVARALGYHYVDKAFIGKVMEQYGLVEFDQEYDRLPGFWDKFNEQKDDRRRLMGNMLNVVIRAVARHGNAVILGRGAFAVLAGFDDVLNVRIQAPEAFRSGQVKAQRKITVEEADATVKQEDKVQAVFLKEFYKLQVDSRDAFDVLVNTAKIAPELAVNWLVDAIRQLEKNNAAQKATTGGIEVDNVLAYAIAAELKCEADHTR